MLFNCKLIPKDVELRTHSDLELHNFELGLDTESTDPSVAHSRRIKTGQLRNKSGFTSSIRTEKSEELSTPYANSDVFIGYFWGSTVDTGIYFTDIFDNERIFVVLVMGYGVYVLPFGLAILILIL
mgnify:FL=1